MPNKQKKYTGIRLVGKKIGDTIKFFKKHPNIAKSILLGTPLLISYGMVYEKGREKGVSQDEMFIISNARDVADDEYNEVIPAQVGENETLFIPDDSIVLVKGKEIVDEENEVIFTDASGESHTGMVEGKYLEGYYPMTQKKLLEYNNVYEIVPKEGANLRIYPSISDRNIIAGIEGGALVFGGVPIATSENEFFWVPILNIGHGMNVGYIRSDLVELQKANVFSFPENEYENFNIPENSVITEQAKARETNKVIMVVDTSKDGNENLNLRQEPSITADVIEELENGTDIYIYQEDMNNKKIAKDGHIWVKVHHIIYGADNNEIIDDTPGYVDMNYLREKEDVIADIEPQAADVVTYAVKDKTNTYFRAEPNADSMILLNLLEKYNVKIKESDLESTIKDGDKEWVKANIHGNEGYINLTDFDEKENYIVISDIEEQIDKDEYEILKYYYSINERGRVTGVDADGQNYTGYDAKKLYSEGVKDSTVSFWYKDVPNDVDVSYAGKISFNAIKIGSISNQKDFAILDRGYNEDLVKASNEAGIAYFPYMYASVTTKEEAEILSNYIINMMNSMENCPSMIYLDYENCERTQGIFSHPNYFDEDMSYEERVRMLREIIDSNTEALAHLCNILSDNGISPKIYTSRQATLDLSRNGEQLLDLYKLNELTGVTDLWITAPDQGGDIHTGINGEYIEELRNEGVFDVVVTQDIMDGMFTVKDEEGKTKEIKLDLDSMTEEDFKEAVLEGAPKTLNGKPVKVEFVQVPNKEITRNGLETADEDRDLE